MNIQRIRISSLLFIFIIASCGAQTTSPAPTDIPAIPHTEASPLEAPTSSSNDPLLFGAIQKSEINPYAANIQELLFAKVMDGLITNGNIIEYQILSSEVFPSHEGGLIAEVYYNVRTTDSSWLVDGGTQTENNWIENKCNRFDFVNTETEFQLKNRRTCN